MPQQPRDKITTALRAESRLWIDSVEEAIIIDDDGVAHWQLDLRLMPKALQEIGREASGTEWASVKNVPVPLPKPAHSGQTLNVDVRGIRTDGAPWALGDSAVDRLSGFCVVVSHNDLIESDEMRIHVSTVASPDWRDVMESTGTNSQNCGVLTLETPYRRFLNTKGLRVETPGSVILDDVLFDIDLALEPPGPQNQRLSSEEIARALSSFALLESLPPAVDDLVSELIEELDAVLVRLSARRNHLSRYLSQTASHPCADELERTKAEAAAAIMTQFESEVFAAREELNDLHDKPQDEDDTDEWREAVQLACSKSEQVLERSVDVGQTKLVGHLCKGTVPVAGVFDAAAHVTSVQLALSMDPASMGYRRDSIRYAFLLTLGVLLGVALRTSGIQVEKWGWDIAAPAPLALMAESGTIGTVLVVVPAFLLVYLDRLKATRSLYGRMQQFRSLVFALVALPMLISLFAIGTYKQMTLDLGPVDVTGYSLTFASLAAVAIAVVLYRLIGRRASDEWMRGQRAKATKELSGV